MIIRWEEPPRSAPSLYNWDEMAAGLQQCPGKWALVLEVSSSSLATTYAYHIRNGERPAFRPAGSFEAKAATAGGQARVYARYIGSHRYPEEVG